MPKIQKTFPSPYGGISEQSPELMLDTQCIDMVNCVPDVVLGLQRRNGTKVQTALPEGVYNKIFHFYDRGEGDERYFFTLTGNSANPIRIFDISGDEKVVSYTDITSINNYLGTTKDNLKAITVQDRTFILNKSKIVQQNITDALNFFYDRPAYYWLSRSSNDVNNKYNYAVYLDGTTYQYASESSVTAATQIASLINAGGLGFSAVAIGSVIKITKTGYYSTGVGGGLRIPYGSVHKYIAMRATPTATIEYIDVTLGDTTITPIEDTIQYKINVLGYYVENVIGGVTTYKTYPELEPLGSSIGFKYYEKQGSNYINPQLRYLDIVKGDNGYFSFSYWDSWGSQASFGWQGTVNKLSDLPSEMPFTNVYVNITGDDNNEFTDYYVTFNESTWVECINPLDNRGTIYNMPIKIDRESNGSFSVSTLSWEQPHIGSVLTNPNPSFVNNTMNDIIFYKNRLGFASGGNITLSETGGYYNFYSKTVLQVNDDDPIDVAIPSGDATNIYYAVPFQSNLFVFTKDTQYLLKSTNGLSPNSVEFDLISKTPMDTAVEPVNAANSLFFISSVGDTASQLREYKYSNDSLVADGVNLSVQTPNLLPNINKIVVDISLGYVFMYSNSTPTVLYCYKYLNQGDNRVQSAFFKFIFPFNIDNMFSNRARLLFITKGIGYDYILYLDLLVNNLLKVDKINEETIEYPYSSYCTLSRWNIKMVSTIETPIDTLVVKRIKFIGTGKYNVDIHRKDYNTTTTRTYDSNSTVDNSASILGKNKNVVITFRSYDNNNFRLDSMILEGMFTQTSREVN